MPIRYAMTDRNSQPASGAAPNHVGFVACVTVHNRAVVLSGTVHYYTARGRALQAVRLTPGTREAESKIQVVYEI